MSRTKRFNGIDGETMGDDNSINLKAKQLEKRIKAEVKRMNNAERKVIKLTNQLLKLRTGMINQVPYRLALSELGIRV